MQGPEHGHRNHHCGSAIGCLGPSNLYRDARSCRHMNMDTESTTVAVQKGVLDPVICTEMQGHDTTVAVQKGVLDPVICTEMQGPVDT